MERGENRPGGEQFAEGSETAQPGRELVYVPYEEGLRALLDEAMSNYNRPAWAGRSEIWYLHIRLRDQGSKLSGDERTEEAETFFNIASALSILGYSKLPESKQYEFRGYLREQLEVDRPDTFKVSNQGRKLLQVVTSALDVEYNALQEEFSYATVLDQPEIEPPTEEDYLNMTEKAIQWEKA